MQMRIGVPSETKTLEGRVALVPAAAGDLVKRGHEVWLQKDAGVKSGFRDEAYTALGVKRSEEHTSGLQSLMRISSAVFCLKKKKTRSHTTTLAHNPTKI